MEIKKRVENLVYYWERDNRPRKQYLHILRDLRDDLEGDYKKLIPSKLQQDEIDGCIKNLKKGFNL